jgi:hypothetical protein
MSSTFSTPVWPLAAKPQAVGRFVLAACRAAYDQ